MDDLSSRFDALVGAIAAVSDTLDRLSREAEDIGGAYGSGFPGLAAQAAILESRLYALTHETASAMGFSLDALRRMERFIRFRAAHPLLDDAEFAAVVDGGALPLSLRNELAGRFPDKLEGLRYLEDLRKGWNAVFGKRSYAGVAGMFTPESGE